ncbi:MAG: hypothetical protein U0263_22080 [Polyangiaceae bacterium]
MDVAAGPKRAAHELDGPDAMRVRLDELTHHLGSLAIAVDDVADEGIDHALGGIQEHHVDPD